MTPGDYIDVEQELAQAHLFILRGEYTEARALLAHLSRSGVPHERLRALEEEICLRQEEAKQTAERHRSWRYYLGLQTIGARGGWFLAAAILALSALWNGILVVGMGRARGFNTVITTHLHTKSYTYHWTHPIYYDVVYSAVLMVAAGVAMGVIVWASRDAAPWEELDTPDPTRYGA